MKMPGMTAMGSGRLCGTIVGCLLRDEQYHHHERTPDQATRLLTGGFRRFALVDMLWRWLALVAAYVPIRLIRRDGRLRRSRRAHPNAARYRMYLLDCAVAAPGNGADKMSDASIATIFGVAIAYALLRFIEGYGLRRQSVWAEVAGYRFRLLSIFRLKSASISFGENPICIWSSWKAIAIFWWCCICRGCGATRSKRRERRCRRKRKIDSDSLMVIIPLVISSRYWSQHDFVLLVIVAP